MQRLEVSGAVRPIYGSFGVKRLRMGAAIPLPTYEPDGVLGSSHYLEESVKFQGPKVLNHHGLKKCVQSGACRGAYCTARTHEVGDTCFFLYVMPLHVTGIYEIRMERSVLACNYHFNEIIIIIKQIQC